METQLNALARLKNICCATGPGPDHEKATNLSVNLKKPFLNNGFFTLVVKDTKYLALEHVSGTKIK
jgi:hypothetical protein